MTIVTDLYLSETELAEALGLALQTIRNWRSRRYGPPCVKVGRKILYRREAVLNWLKKDEK